MKKNTMIAAVLATLIIGCSSADITAPNGWHYKRTAFISTLKVGKVDVLTETNGAIRVSVEQLENDAVTGAKVVADSIGPIIAASKAAAK